MAAVRMFHSVGEFCASHPWEVIVTTLTFTAYMLTVEPPVLPLQTKSFNYHSTSFSNETEYNAVDVIGMTIIRCVAVLYSYYKFLKVHRLGSKYILVIAGMLTAFSGLVFTSAVLNFMQIDLTDLKDALFCFLLLVDLSKTAMLAQFAVNTRSHEDIKFKIGKGMSVLGPTITLDTIVETLVIRIGTLSGVHRLEMLASFASLAVIVNYIIFMTFYPACLDLILELSKTGKDKRQAERLFSKPFREDDPKSNPVVDRVKIIMSAGLMLVYARSHWFYHNETLLNKTAIPNIDILNSGEDHTMREYIIKWITLSADHIVILILLLALVVKFVFFETKEFEEPSRAMSSGQRNDTLHKSIQTEQIIAKKAVVVSRQGAKYNRSLEECLNIYRSTLSADSLTDEEVLLLVNGKHIASYQIERSIANADRGVRIRRKMFSTESGISEALSGLPYEDYDYSKVMGRCCENVIGYMPIPVGIAGPLLLDGKFIQVPMATTEGCLVASTNRGCLALSNCGTTSRIVADGMTRGPVVRFPSVARASEAMAWIESVENFDLIKQTFDSTSRFATLTKIQVRIAGRYLFIRFVAKTGDAMGMNMVSKGTEKALGLLNTHFTEMEILSLSGNFCADKKSTAVNWIHGRGKSVVCEAIVSSEIVTSVLKTSVHALIDVNISKNLIGSAVAGSLGGFNAQAANVVTAIFIATGQDPAQNVVSSSCITLMEPWGEDGADLYISCTMPSIEVGTVGGGTLLPAQSACLEMLGVKGPNVEEPGENANTLARIVCATVLAGELSLMAALTAGHLVESHMKYNRSATLPPKEN